MFGTRLLGDISFRRQIVKVAALFCIVITGSQVAMPVSGTILASSAVTFHQNDFVGDSVIDSQIAATDVSLTLFKSLSIAFVNKGYTFQGWNTSFDGSGIAYSDGAMYNFALGNLDLWAQWIPNHVSFYENAGPLDSVTAQQSATSSTSLTSFTALSPSFAKTGYTFAGWSTSPDGTGTAYSDGATYDFTLGSMLLYAQWTPATYAVNFAANGGTVSTTSGSATGGGSLVLPTASEAGYVFDGWYTAAQGGSFVGQGGASYTPTSSTTLYAQWTPASYVVDFAADGGTVSSTSASFTSGASPLTLPTASQPGYVFDGWYTAAQGGSLVGQGGGTFTPSSSTTLYAQWSAATSQVNFVANGGVVATTSSSYTTGSSPVILPTPTQPGFTFNGWFTAPEGGSLVGMGGGPYVPSSSTTLFAQWTAIPVFNVAFSANGGSGTVGTVAALSGSTISLPSPASMSRPGYAFMGWNSVADGSGTAFNSTSTLSLTGPMTLYAQWRQLPAATVTFAMNGAHGVVPAISAYDGATEVLAAPPALARPGYVFTGWNTRADGKGSTFAAGATMTLSNSVTLYAQWSGHAPARLVGPIGPFVSTNTNVTGSLATQVRQLAALVVRQQRSAVTLYGYVSTAATSQAQVSQGRARVAAVARALRLDLARLHHGKVRVVVVDEGLTAGASNRVSVVVR